MSEFERQLKGIPQRKAPAELRHAILGSVDSEPKSTRLIEWLRWLWEVPAMVRVGIAVVWISGICLNLATPGRDQQGVANERKLVAEHGATLFAFHRARLKQFLDPVYLNES